MKTGFVGWRGMVGSVLMERAREEGLFGKITPSFFSTSDIGGVAPVEGGENSTLLDAFNIEALADHEIIVACQGGDYTKEVYPKLRASGWKGYWIDAASTLRLADEAIIILDPVNREVIDQGLESGVKTFIGGNCTVALMLMATSGLFKQNLVEWVHASTYQAASGAGAKAMAELMRQSKVLGNLCTDDPSQTALELERSVTAKQNDGTLNTDNFGAPLSCSLIPWCDSAVEGGLTREEWKGQVETNKILGTKKTIPVDGICVRIGALRCHSQGLLIKLSNDVPIQDIEEAIVEANQWATVIENSPSETRQFLTPAAVSGKLDVPIGRIRKSKIGPEYLEAFTVGDQLLWGAAEPLLRMVQIIAT